MHSYTPSLVKSTSIELAVVRQRHPPLGPIECRVESEIIAKDSKEKDKLFCMFSYSVSSSKNIYYCIMFSSLRIFQFFFFIPNRTQLDNELCVSVHNAHRIRIFEHRRSNTICIGSVVDRIYVRHAVSTTLAYRL